MKQLTKKDFKKGAQFMYKNGDSNTLYEFRDGFITTKILFNDGVRCVDGNQYNINSITDKYLSMWDINFGQKRNYKVSLNDLIIVKKETINI